MYYYRTKDNKGTLKAKEKVIDKSWIQIEESEYNTITNEIQPKQIASNKEKIKARQEIMQLKVELSKLDYKTIKYIEGALSEEEFEEVKNAKQQMRNRINELEEELK